jgi:hypothetical protein
MAKRRNTHEGFVAEMEEVSPGIEVVGTYEVFAVGLTGCSRR